MIELQKLNHKLITSPETIQAILASYPKDKQLAILNDQIKLKNIGLAFNKISNPEKIWQFTQWLLSYYPASEHESIFKQLTAEISSIELMMLLEYAGSNKLSKKYNVKDYILELPTQVLYNAINEEDFFKQLCQTEGCPIFFEENPQSQVTGFVKLDRLIDRLDKLEHVNKLRKRLIVSDGNTQTWFGDNNYWKYKIDSRKLHLECQDLINKCQNIYSTLFKLDKQQIDKLFEDIHDNLQSHYCNQKASYELVDKQIGYKSTLVRFNELLFNIYELEHSNHSASQLNLEQYKTQINQIAMQMAQGRWDDSQLIFHIQVLTNKSGTHLENVDHQCDDNNRTRGSALTRFSNIFSTVSDYLFDNNICNPSNN